MAKVLVMAAALIVAGGAPSVHGGPHMPECLVLAGDVAVAERLCDALRVVLTQRPVATAPPEGTRLLLEVVDAVPTRIVARLVTVLGEMRNEGPALTLQITDRADLPQESIADFAQTLVTHSGLSLP